MRITFIGTGAGSSVGSKRVKSSILVNESILFDLGPGADLKLEDLKIYDKPKALFVTHLHIDHFNGLFDYLVQRKIRGIKDLEIYSPQGMEKIIESYVAVGNKISTKIYESTLPRGKIDDLEVYAVKACHSIYAVSYVVRDKSRKVIYTGDTSEPCDDILEEAKDSDLIIHEATCVNNCSAWGHTSINQIISLFDRKRKVIITHIPIHEEEEIIKLGEGKVIIAFDGLSIDV